MVNWTMYVKEEAKEAITRFALNIGMSIGEAVSVIGKEIAEGRLVWEHGEIRSTVLSEHIPDERAEIERLKRVIERYESGENKILLKKEEDSEKEEAQNFPKNEKDDLSGIYEKAKGHRTTVHSMHEEVLRRYR